jgi:Undecaprenyl-phosphate glucose phosphotransferase
VVGVCDEERRDVVCRRLWDHGVEVVEFTLIPPGSVERAEFQAACRSAANAVRETLGRSALAAVYLFLPWRDMGPLDEIRSLLSPVGVPVVLFADAETEMILSLPQVKSGGMRGLEIQRAPLSFPDRVVKRALDLVVAGGALTLLSPLMALTAMAIRLQNDGPILFRQDRKGFGGRPFGIYKFRTMSVMENGADIRQVEKDDCRVTRLGRFLRRTSIDELPQLFNVLRGDMSVVGPRPHALAHDNFYDRLITSYAFRQRVKPGITGWAQVNGFRGETREVERMTGRVAHDLWYIEHWSIWLDFRILVKTATMIFFDKNAY